MSPRTTLLPYLAILFSVLSVSLGASQPHGTSTTAGDKKYFDLVPSDASFGRDAYGRAYATIGSHTLAIGGRDAAGVWLRTVDILEHKADGTSSLHAAELSQPVAFAAATAFEGMVYLVGGIGPDGAVSRVTKLEWSGTGLKESELPPLPEPLLLAGAAVHRCAALQYLMVVGGVTGADASEANPRAFMLQISPPPKDGAKWEQIANPPMGARLAPTVVETYNEVVVLGGYTLESTGRIKPSPDVWGYSHIPRDGHQKAGWERRSALPVPVAQPAASKTGQSHLTLIGGDQSGGTLTELLDGRKARQPLNEVWSFHDPTDAWNRIGSIPSPAYGGSLGFTKSTSYFLVDARDAHGAVVPSTLLNFISTTKKLGYIDWSIIGVYFLVLAFVGAHFARRQSGSSSFALGGQNMKWWASAISMMATGVSSISFMALPALVACIGLGTTGPAVFILAGTVVSAYITFPLLRRLRIVSVYGYIEQRFGVALRLLGSFNNIVGQTMGRVGIVILLPALAMSSMTGMNPLIAVILIGVVTTIYSAAGGFEAVVWTDVVQGLIMFVGFIALGLLALANVDGGIDTVLAYGRDMDRLNPFLFEWDARTPMVYYAIPSTILAIMSFASDQSTAQRVLAVPMKDVRKLAFMSGIFGVAVAYLTGLIGIFLFAFYKSNPEFLSPVMQNDQVVPLFIVSKVPEGLSGILMATLFAASMSTVSSSINSSSVCFAEDFYKRMRKNVSGKEEMRAMQAFTLLIGFLGTGMAVWLLSMDLPTLWESFMRIMSYLTGGIWAVFILGMFTRRTHELGAIIGVVAAFILAYIINTSVWNIHWSALGMFVTFGSVIIGYLSSLIIPWQRKDLTGLTVWNQVKCRVTDDELQKDKSETPSP